MNLSDLQLAALALIDTTSFVQETIETRAERPLTTLSHLESSVGVREGSEAISQCAWPGSVG